MTPLIPTLPPIPVPSAIPTPTIDILIADHTTRPPPIEEISHDSTFSSESAFDVGSGRKKIFGVVLTGTVFLVVGAVLFYFSYLRQRISLARALTALMNSSSVHIQAKIPLISNIKIVYDTDVVTNGDFLRESKFTTLFPTNSSNSAAFTVSLISDSSDEYVKPSHSHLAQINNLMRSNDPEIFSKNYFKEYQKILAGSYWLHYKKDLSASLALSQDKANTFSFFFELSKLFTINSYIGGFEKDGKLFEEYRLGLKKNAFISFLNLIQNDITAVNFPDLSRVSEAVESNTNLSRDFMIVYIDTDSKRIDSVEFLLPKDLLDEIASAKPNKIPYSKMIATLEANTSFFLDLIQRDKEINVVSVSFSNYNDVRAKMKPTDTIDFDELDLGVERFAIYLANMADPDTVNAALSQENMFLTLAYQVKEYFDSKNFINGLKTAKELQVNAKSADEKSIAYYWMGMNAYNLKQIDDAEGYFKKSSTLKADFASPYASLASIAIDKNNYQEVMDYSKLCLNYDINFPWCHYNLGVAYTAMNQVDLGLIEFQKAVELDPNNLIFRDNLIKAVSQ